MTRSSCFSLSLLAISLLFSLISFSQSVTLSGSVRNKINSENVSAVSIIVKGSALGTFTDDRGNFKITVPKLPVTLVASSIGFETQELTVDNASSNLTFDFVPASSLGQEVVVSATRTPQRILESPVTVERVSAAAIRNAPAASYYDVLSNVKGVDITTSSLTFKTPSTRGFNGSGNTRFNQLIEAMDNQAPGLNFSVGSIIGISELDVESMELLPGASSALYGPGGMNGTLLINSKNPFRYQGLSFQIKQGLMHISSRERDVSAYYNWNLRWAKTIGDKFAFKISSDMIKADDWLAYDYRNYKRLGTSGAIIPGTRQSDPNYDGVNVYGDETSNSFFPVLRGVAQQAPFLNNYINGLLAGSDSLVSRTGYKEIDVVDPVTLNYRLSGAMHYKLTSAIEASLSGYFGSGNTVYTGSDRYSLKDLKIAQYKLELNHNRWFLRAYTTQENAGESFNATVTTRLLNEAWKPSGGSTGWYAQYGQAFLASKLSGATNIDAHNAARAAADVGRPAEGSQQFKQIFNNVRSIPISKGGGLFLDKTDLYNYEGQYNLADLTKGYAEILVGGNFKKYKLNSEGTLFADSAGPIGINEVGAYIQASRGFMDDRLKLTLSGRYDKNENFKGRFTPRATALFKLFNNANLRLSYQTAYRFPSTQQQWINLVVGGGVYLIGGVQELKDFYKFNSNPVYTLASVQTGTPKTALFDDFKPESVRSYEVGFKTLTANNKLLIDLYGYLGEYTDFIVRTLVVQNPGASNQRIFSVPLNNPDKVNTNGFGLSLDYSLPQGFTLGANFASDVLEKIPEGFIAFFNAPKYRGNFSVGNSGIGTDKRIGFNVVYKWQDDFFYESDFANGSIEDIHTLDAQLSYKLQASKSVIKIGANNLLNEYYRTAAGNPSIGGLYYVSYGYNIF